MDSTKYLLDKGFAISDIHYFYKFYNVNQIYIQNPFEQPYDKCKRLEVESANINSYNLMLNNGTKEDIANIIGLGRIGMTINNQFLNK